MKNNNNTMPKGEYVIVDLCYVMDNDWDEVCSLLFQKNEDEADGSRTGGVFQLRDGRKFALYGTAWGDGSYGDNLGRSYGVDAGVIGCIATKDLPNWQGSVHGGNVHTFTEDFETGYDNGTIFFGDVRIETDPEYDEEEDETCPTCGNPTYALACHCDGWDKED